MTSTSKAAGNAPESATEAPEDHAGPAGLDPGADPAQDGAEGASRREARYRTQLREVEAERDELREQVETARKATEAAQRALVDRLAADSRVKAEALWASLGDAGLSSLLDDDGNISAERVTEACESAASSFGLSRTPRPDLSQGASGAAPPAGDAMADALRSFGAR